MEKLRLICFKFNISRKYDNDDGSYMEIRLASRYISRFKFKMNPKQIEHNCVLHGVEYNGSARDQAARVPSQSSNAAGSSRGSRARGSRFSPYVSLDQIKFTLNFSLTILYSIVDFNKQYEDNQTFLPVFAKLQNIQINITTFLHT